MKYLYTTCIALLSLLTIAQAQNDDLVCFNCPPSEAITAYTIQDLRGSSAVEGYTFDISFRQDSQAVAVIRQGNPDAQFIVRIYEPTFRPAEDNPDDYKYDWLSWGNSQEVTRADNLTQVVFHPEGHLLVVGDDAGQVQFWDVDTLSLLYASYGEDSINELLFHPDGFVTLEGKQTIALHRLNDDIVTFELPDNVTSIQMITLSPDYRWLIASADTGLLVYDLSTLSLIRQIDMERQVVSVLFSPSELHDVFVLSDKVELWSWSETPEDLSFQATFETLMALEERDYFITDSAISPDGSLLVTVDQQDCMRTWDVLQHKEILTPITDIESFNCSSISINAIAFSPDSLWFTYGEAFFVSMNIP